MLILCIYLASLYRTKAFAKANPIVSSDRRVEIAAQWDAGYKRRAGKNWQGINILDIVGDTVVDVIEVPLKYENIEKPIVG